MEEKEILELRRQARAAKHDVDLALVELHRKAVIALLDPARGIEIRQRALQQIEKWDRHQLCHPRYIQTWREILTLPATAIQQRILRDDAEGVSLRQNSPFGFLVDKAA